jgi:hypothetical protein
MKFFKGRFELHMFHLLGFKPSGSIGLLAGCAREFHQKLVKPLVGSWSLTPLNSDIILHLQSTLYFLHQEVDCQLKVA